MRKILLLALLSLGGCDIFGKVAAMRSHCEQRTVADRECIVCSGGADSVAVDCDFGK